MDTQHIPDAPWCLSVAIPAYRILGMRTALDKEGMEGAKAAVGRTDWEQYIGGMNRVHAVDCGHPREKHGY